MRGSRRARRARDHRPEWVSCRPTTRPSSSVRVDVRVDQLGAQRGEVVDGRSVDHELVRVGPPVVARPRPPPAPDELAPLAPKRRQRRRTRSVGRPSGVAVPALHRQHREAVADRAVPAEPSVNVNGVGERPGRVDVVVDRAASVDAERGEAVAQLVERPRAA